MTDRMEYPENLRQFLDVVASILRRIAGVELDKNGIPCLDIACRKGGGD